MSVIICGLWRISLFKLQIFQLVNYFQILLEYCFSEVFYSVNKECAE